MQELQNKLNILSTRSESLLDQNLKVDLPTNATPEKRAWPNYAADDSLDMDLEPLPLLAALQQNSNTCSKADPILVPIAQPKQRNNSLAFKVLQDKQAGNIMSVVAANTKPEPGSRASNRR